jgi:hypothetical protein
MKKLWNIPLGQRSVSPLHTQQREAGKESVASLDELQLCVKKRKGHNLVQLRQNRVLFGAADALLHNFSFLDLVC